MELSHVKQKNRETLKASLTSHTASSTQPPMLQMVGLALLSEWRGVVYYLGEQTTPVYLKGVPWVGGTNYGLDLSGMASDR